MKKEINLFMKKLREMPDFNRVKFVILFGSQAERRAGPMSDYDFAVYYEGDGKERYDFLKRINFNEKFDAKVFQDLPLFIQKEIFKGKIIYAEDLTFVYDIAYRIMKEFDRFKRYYYDYIKTRELRIK